MFAKISPADSTPPKKPSPHKFRLAYPKNQTTSSFPSLDGQKNRFYKLKSKRMSTPV